MIIFDKAGNQYNVSADEAREMLATGAYSAQKGHFGDQPMPASHKQPFVTLIEKKTGKKLMRRPVDAYELVNSGAYMVDPPKAAQAAPIPLAPPANSNAKKSDAPNTPDPNALPVLTEEASKDEIMAALQKYGVQYRANMSKTDLLNLWQTYILERGQG